MKRVALAICMIAFCCGTLAASSSTVTATGVVALSTEKILDSIGVNTHINYTDGAYADVSKVGDRLQWLGVTHIREYTPGHSTPLSSYVYLARRGFKFTFIVDDDVVGSIDKFRQIEAQARGSVVAIEGFNEINNWPVKYAGLTGQDAGLAGQKAIYERVRSTPSLSQVPVYDLTGYDPKPVKTRAGSADFTNSHTYPQNGQQPNYDQWGSVWIDWAFAEVRKFKLPMVMTEFGYFTMPQSGWYVIGVDEATQAKGTLNGLLDAVNTGISRTYIYELLDEKPDPQHRDMGMHFGLFNFDHSPKASARALRNFILILKANDKVAVNESANGRMSFTLSGWPVSAQRMLMQKKDGRFVLAMWNEVPFWNRETGKPIDSPAVKVPLEFGKTARVVNVYDPLAGTAPTVTQRNVAQMTIDVPDHVVLVEVTFPD
ncbi:calcium-binding protein [Paraburkholderia rhizosphaerae]|uniref:Calcium-binding protein n=1 Tax=Paraburkholderia rhizosphaerae TaxID=480658 RepID=A0A4V3HFR4_9BURK|nr:calcium-binding protein [Paraburkholderia rhizosphaerae]TDY54697.1 hypothetical protein BX592_101153 [Paraburkholderia rhizosphaerae]